MHKPYADIIETQCMRNAGMQFFGYVIKIRSHKGYCSAQPDRPSIPLIPSSLSPPPTQQPRQHMR